MRRLIVNADDFGFTAGVNRAIVEAHTRGIVTSSTLMANGRAFDDAVSLAKTIPRLSVGCHIVLIDGRPVLDAARLPSITAKSSGEARFRDGLKSFAARALAGRLDPDEIEAEATAQIRKIQSAGIAVTHVDSHKHTHLFPAVLRPLLRAARRCNVPAVRNPFGQMWPLPLIDVLRRRQLWKRFAQLNVLRNFAAKFRGEVESHGLRTTDGSVAVLVTGILDLPLFSKIVDSIPEGTWEFVCHPGYNDADLGEVRTRLRQSRAQELELLTSPEAREVLRRRRIQLISYREL